MLVIFLSLALLPLVPPPLPLIGPVPSSYLHPSVPAASAILLTVPTVPLR